MTADQSATESDRPISVDTEAELDEALADNDVVLVEFYTEGCSICGSMEPILTQVARATDAVVVTVNPRNDPPLVDRFQVQSVPMFALFVDGEQVAERAEGFIPAEDMVTWVDDTCQ